MGFAPLGRRMIRAMGHCDLPFGDYGFRMGGFRALTRGKAGAIALEYGQHMLHNRASEFAAECLF